MIIKARFLIIYIYTFIFILNGYQHYSSAATPHSKDYIKHEDRIACQGVPQCVFASLETLANHNKIEPLYGLTQKYFRESGPGEVASILHRNNVDHYMQTPPNKRTDWIEWACKKKLGCLIGLNGSHAVVLMYLDNEYATIISNMRQTKETQRMPRSEFDRAWDGWCTIIYKKGKQSWDK